MLKNNHNKEKEGLIYLTYLFFIKLYLKEG